MRARGIYRPRGGMLLPSYIGPIATRCRICQNIAPNNSTYGFTKRTYHYARDNITWLKIGIPNWCSTGNTEEALSGGSGWGFAASIEYPFTVATAGTVCNVATWGGAASTVMASGVAMMWSDWMHFPIPAGAKFGSRMWINITSATGQFTVYNTNDYGGNWRDATGGDVFDFNGANQTAGGAMTNSAADPIDITPILIGVTRRPTIAIMGDGRQSGWNETVDANAGDAGETTRTYGKYFNYLNLASGQDRVADFIASDGSGSTIRRQLAGLCSHISMNIGFEDIVAGATAATVEANIATMMGMPGLVGKPTIYDLMLPLSASTDAWATTGNQTTNATNAARNTVNTWLASGQGSSHGVNDPRSAAEFPPLPSGIWNAPGYTTDGFNPSQASYQDIMNGGCVDPRKIVRRR